MDKKVIGIIMLLLVCCCSSSASIGMTMMGGDDDDDTIKSSAGPTAGPSAGPTAGDSDDDSDSDSSDDDDDGSGSGSGSGSWFGTPPSPPVLCGRSESSSECKKLLTSNGDWIENLDTEPRNSGVEIPDYKNDYHYEPGTYYEGGQVFNVKPIPGSVGPEREKHCFDKCTNDSTCDMVTFARGTPRGEGNVNVECWGRSGSAKRIFRTDDGRFTRGDDLMDSDYHNTFHKKSSTTLPSQNLSP